VSRSCPWQAPADLLDQLSGDFLDVPARRDQVLSAREPIGARTFDANSGDAHPQSEPHDLGQSLCRRWRVIESTSRPSSSTALQVSVALCASMPMTLAITTSLVQMRHDAGHRSDNNPLSSTRFYQARTDGP
jgi:hypothetical protein